jgi:dipeptidyl aminopeptidase/acylaminoacyl peptidase/outer membrane protein assembly factor BamB
MRRLIAVLVLLLLPCLLPAQQAQRWTPELMMSVKEITSVVPSPDGKRVAFAVRQAVMEGEKSEYLTQIHLANSDGSNGVQLTQGDKSSEDPQWSPDGETIAFVSDRSGKKNVWLIPVRGGEAWQLTDIKSSVSHFRWSPDGKSIAYTAVDPPTPDEEKADKEKNDARVIDEHIKMTRLYVISVGQSAKEKREARKLTTGNYCIGNDFDSTGFDWSPDGKSIVFTQTPTLREDDWTKGDISIVDVASGTIRPLAATRAAELSPFFSPDGRWVAFLKSDDPPTWGVNFTIQVVPATGGKPRELAETFDHSPTLIGWSADSKKVYYLESFGTTNRLCALPLEGKAEIISQQQGVMGNPAGLVALNATRTMVGFAHENSDKPVEAFVSRLDRFAPVRVSTVNAAVPQLSLGKTEVRRWKSPDSKEIEGLLTLPVNYEAGKRYPLLLVIHGGPMGVFSQDFIGAQPVYLPYPIATFSARGYAVLRCNPRGSTGYGKDFRYANYKDWGGGDYKDLMAGVDEMIRLGIADPNRLGVAGWSFGGYMTSWIITQTKRFKAASVGAGLPNLMSFPGTSDVPGFLPDYFGAESWDNLDIYRKHSPLFHIKGVNTPTLIQHGEKDERVSIAQSYELYNALKRQGCPVKMVVYPRAAHVDAEPKQKLDMMRRNVEWFDKHLGVASAEAEALWAAAGRGDAKAIEALLTGGADINAKTPYGATALSFAADKGHLDAVKLLLKHKAAVNTQDTFYKVSPLDWAVMRNHTEVVKALIEAGADGAESALLSAAAQGNVELVRAILDKAKPSEAALTRALAATQPKYATVADMLKRAGAKAPPPPKVEKPGDNKALADYLGAYRNTNGVDLTIAAAEGKLTASFGAGGVVSFKAAEKDSFKSDAGVTLTFRREGDKVAGLTMKSDKVEMIFQRAVPVTEPAPGKATVEDRGGVVKQPLNWPSFRGPNASGVADGQFPPIAWDAGKMVNVRWKTPIPGLGHSCPVVWEDRIYLTSAVSADGKEELKAGLYGNVESVKESADQSWRVYCLDKNSGRVLWERTACKGQPKVKRHPKASHANPTAATDGRHVVVSFGSEGLYCYDRDGKLLWEKNLGVLNSGWFYDAGYQWGFGSSPILYKGLVIVQCDIGKNSFMAAYQAADGREVWRKSRDEVPSWGTPTIVAGPNRVELVTNATKFARGYDPLTGEELWRLGRHAEITVPTPIFGAGLIFITSGYSPVQPIYAIRPGARGDISLGEDKTANEAVAWSKSTGGPYMPTPIVYGDYLYTCSNAGVVTCYEAKTGKQVYKERLGGSGGYTASPVAADGKLYFPSEENGVRVVRAGPKFEVLAVNPLGEACLATPAISDGMIFVRTQHHLFAFGRKK